MENNVITTKYVKRLKTGDSVLCYSETLGWYRWRTWYGSTGHWMGYKRKNIKTKTSLKAAAKYYGIAKEELSILVLTYGK